MPDIEESEEVLVIAKRSPKPTPEPRLIVNLGEGGAGPFENPIFEWLRAALGNETEFYIDKKFRSSTLLDFTRESVRGR